MRPVVRLVAATAAGLLAGFLPAQAANDPGLPRQWNMPLIGADSSWSIGTGQGITIAVVDTGVHLAHEDLSARLVSGRNFVTANAQPQDDNGHGTHVAGIAAATMNNGAGVVGVAPAARIMPVKVLDRNGEGTYANAAAGIRWAVDNGAHVVNLSLGSTVASLIGSPGVFVDAIDYAWTKGVLCVVAAGNDFILSSDFSNEDAIVVSATTRSDTAADYSNGVGQSKWGLAAPGGAGTGKEADDILSTYWPHTEENAFGKQEYGSYAIASGTSMAAPHVAGAAALLRSLGLTPLQTVDRLRTTAKDLGRKGRDSLYGDGRLEVAKAVAELAPSGGGGSSGGGGTAATTAPTTTTSVRRSSGGPGTTTTAPGGSRAVPPSTANTTSGSLDVTQAAPGSVDEMSTEGDDAKELDALGDESPPNGGDTVWPVAVLAAAALAAVALAATRARARRLRV